MSITLPSFDHRVIGPRMYLRRLTIADATYAYAHWFDDPEVHRYLETRHVTSKDLPAYINEKNLNSNALLLGIFDRQTDTHIGNIKLEPIDWNAKKAVFGIVIGDRSYWGKGYGTAATTLLADFAFHQLGLHEIELGVATEHEHARRVYEKSGFQFQRYQRKFWNGLLYEEAVMTLARDGRLEHDAHDHALPSAHTVVFFWERSSSDLSPLSQKRILLTVAEPLSVTAFIPLIRALRQDQRVGAIGVLASGSAAPLLQPQIEADFEIIYPQVHRDTSRTWFEILRHRAQTFDTIVFSIDGYTSMNISSLYDNYEHLRIQRLFIMQYSWSSLWTMRYPFHDPLLRAKITPQITSIFCNDVFSKDMIMRRLPEIPERHIFADGTPVLNEAQRDFVPQQRREGRKQLGIHDNEFVLLYLGDCDGDYSFDKEIDWQINTKTFIYAVGAILSFARRHPDRRFVCIVRPHPRDAQADALFDYAQSVNPSSNLRFLDGAKRVIDIHRVVAASDVVMGIASTENHLAALRGIPAIFLGFHDDHDTKLGGRVLDYIYGHEAVQVLHRTPLLSVARTSEELTHILERISVDKTPEVSVAAPSQFSITHMLDVLLQ